MTACFTIEANARQSSKKTQKKSQTLNEQKAKNGRIHIIREGDTLYSLSKKYKLPVDEIADANNINDPGSIKKGMKIRIPGKQKKNILSASESRADRDEAEENKKSTNPRFQWPLKKIIEFKRDGGNGVNPIGIIITANPGSSVVSSASGKVEKIGEMRGFGKYVVVKHGDRFATVYSNLERVSVSEGEQISAGRIIGRIDCMNNTLHFQIDIEGKPENPLRYLPKKS